MIWSLKRKLYFAFGSIVVVVAILGGLTIFRMQQTQHLADEQMRYEVIAHNSERLMKLLQEVLLAESRYFSRFGNDDALKQHRAFLDEFDSVLADAEAQLRDQDGDVATSLDKTRRLIEDYRRTFNDARSAFLRRGHQDAGLEGEFREAVHAVESLAESTQDQELMILMLQCRRTEKDFLLRGDEKYVTALHQRVDAAIAHSKTLSAQEAPTEELVTLFKEYRKKFDESVALINKLRSHHSSMEETELATESVLQDLVDHTDGKVESARHQAAATRQATIPIVLGLFAIAIVLALAVARGLSNQVTTAIAVLSDGTRRMMRGDLNVSVDVQSRDELGELGVSFNGMAKALREMTQGITDAVGSTNTTVGELRTTVNEQGATMQQQASSVSETVATVDELSRSSEQVSEVAMRVMQDASQSLNKSDQGREAIEHSVQGMDAVREQVEAIAATILELSDKTQQIGTIIATVDDFAEQSSLLALNASIEAARAGESGKAFGVVAAEVKSLAEQSQQATERVRSILSDIQRATHTAVMVTEEGSKRVDRGVDLVNAAGQVIDQLAESIRAASESAKQIAAAARQQSNGVEQISVAMAGIEQFSKQNVEAIRQTETVAQGLASTAAQLESRIAQYRAH